DRRALRRPSRLDVERIRIAGPRIGATERGAVVVDAEAGLLIDDPDRRLLARERMIVSAVPGVPRAIARPVALPGVAAGSVAGGIAPHRALVGDAVAARERDRRRTARGVSAVRVVATEQRNRTAAEVAAVVLPGSEAARDRRAIDQRVFGARRRLRDV